MNYFKRKLTIDFLLKKSFLRKKNKKVNKPFDQNVFEKRINLFLPQKHSSAEGYHHFTEIMKPTISIIISKILEGLKLVNS